MRMTTSNPIPSSKTFLVHDQASLKNKMLSWIKQFNIFCFLDSHHYELPPHRFNMVAGAGASASFTSLAQDFSAIDEFIQPGKWTFGHISYEQGAAWHGVNTIKKDPVAFPPFFFFRPEHVLVLENGVLLVESAEPDKIYEEILAMESTATPGSSIPMEPRLSHDAYLERIAAIKAHILRGDAYEVNFCQEFFAEDVEADPAELYKALSQLSPNPFSGFYRVNDQYLVCASPERFLFREGETLISQPMKGTSKRWDDPSADEASRKELFESAKDRSENVMVVDLVRNDLSRVCRAGSVEVEELFGIYSFPNVHQMVSTVKGRLETNVYFSHIIKASFPMGSMTGAPKKRVIEIIDRYEPVARGIFSGSIGYIDPQGNFDLNVVIRSMMYNAATGYLSYQVGSGITFYSQPEKEWEECLLKGMAIKKVLTGGQHS